MTRIEEGVEKDEAGAAGFASGRMKDEGSAGLTVVGEGVGLC
jgi:hypothetical protein